LEKHKKKWEISRWGLKKANEKRGNGCIHGHVRKGWRKESKSQRQEVVKNAGKGNEGQEERNVVGSNSSSTGGSGPSLHLGRTKVLEAERK